MEHKAENLSDSNVTHCHFHFIVDPRQNQVVFRETGNDQSSMRHQEIDRQEIKRLYPKTLGGKITQNFRYHKGKEQDLDSLQPPKRNRGDRTLLRADGDLRANTEGLVPAETPNVLNAFITLAVWICVGKVNKVQRRSWDIRTVRASSWKCVAEIGDSNNEQDVWLIPRLMIDHSALQCSCHDTQFTQHATGQLFAIYGKRRM